MIEDPTDIRLYLSPPGEATPAFAPEPAVAVTSEPEATLAFEPVPASVPESEPSPAAALDAEATVAIASAEVPAYAPEAEPASPALDAEVMAAIESVPTVAPEPPPATAATSEIAPATFGVHAEPAGAAEPSSEPSVPPRGVDPAAERAREDARERARAAWQRLVDARAAGDVIEGKVKSAVKGGLLVDLSGYRGFLPASQARAERGAPIESLVGQTIPLKVLDTDEARKRAVVSHRRAFEERRRAARAALLASLHPGDEREATVLRLTDFGAFVDLGEGLDALIPMSELDFERVASAADVLSVNDRVKVRILRIDASGKKVAASRKAALHDPWRDHADLLRRGNVLSGTVVAKERDLQVELAPGLIGAVSEREVNLDDYEIGESIEVSVRTADARNRRIRLSTLHGVVASAAPTGFMSLGDELGRKNTDDG